jgi:multiple sugar transport system substrate-binding protein
MNRFTAALSIILVLSLTACGGPAGSDSGTPESAAASQKSLSVTGEITGEITVSTYDTLASKAFLEDAARLFMEQYPGTTVNVETFSAMPEVKTSEQGNQQMVTVQAQDDPQGRADYVNKISTALMSGEGADILAMDVLPLYKYVESGQLENLAAYMEADPDFHRGDYRENILDAIAYGGGTWFIPMDYTFDYYAYDSTLLPESASSFGTGEAYSTQELIALAESSFDGSSELFSVVDYTKGRGGSLWQRLLEEYYGSFIDLESKTANFSDGSFASLLESVKQYSEQGYVSKGVTGQADAGMMMRQAGETLTERAYFKPKNIFNLVSLFTRDLGMRLNMMAEGGTMTIGDDDEIAGIAANADGSVPFTYEQAYGINANSKNKKTAWAFLKFLLSEEMQLNTNLRPTALPVNNSAREKKAETVMTGAMGPQSQAPDEKLLQALEQYNQAAEELSGQINAYVFRDTIVNDMIAAEVAYFFDGTKTAQEVADTLQSKVSLYLNE